MIAEELFANYYSTAFIGTCKTSVCTIIRCMVHQFPQFTGVECDMLGVSVEMGRQMAMSIAVD